MASLFPNGDYIPVLHPLVAEPGVDLLIFYSAVCQILIIHWLKKGARHRLAALSSDTESLLGCSAAEDKAVVKTQGKQHAYASGQIKVRFHPSFSWLSSSSLSQTQLAALNPNSPTTIVPNILSFMNGDLKCLPLN